MTCEPRRLKTAHEFSATDKKEAFHHRRPQFLEIMAACYLLVFRDSMDGFLESAISKSGRARFSNISTLTVCAQRHTVCTLPTNPSVTRLPGHRYHLHLNPHASALRIFGMKRDSDGISRCVTSSTKAGQSFQLIRGLVATARHTYSW